MDHLNVRATRRGLLGALMLLALSLGAIRCDDGDGSTGKICGGFAGFTCAASEYCAYEGAGLCGQADASAVCKVRPSVCTDVADPVCGCDGNSYANPCSAARASTGYKAKGACP